jgi:shikimate kinase
MIKELSSLEGTVIATGGGAILSADNRRRLNESGVVVYLRASVSEQLKRTGRSRKRPLLNRGNPRETLEAMAKTRNPLYEEMADLSLDTSNQRVKSVAKQLRDLLEQRGDLPLRETG